ncbi:neurogenic locus notch homolog protein 1-like isoform X2 [Patiria miniata]|uniref:EGF-like domain-containing protein n=1 Tax=Patiria miniata TaxID=46514 RepID=A0A913ZY97_PATMI|nr:neurogenic locus notch homolog protein 1-like isoform X2 [Patiria miniata]
MTGQLSTMYTHSFLLLTMIPAALSACPPIHIKMQPDEDDWCPGGCPSGSYCQDSSCLPCSPCPDPYTLAERGETEMYIIPGCINNGYCPNTCAANSFTPKANASLCDCEGVTPPPPVTTPVMCKDGCVHGHCDIPDECICESDWEGGLCDTLPCIPGCMSGYCNTSSGECVCSSGWGGDICDQDLRYCSSNQPCRNGGTCLDSEDGNYTCQCVLDFTGITCETATILHLCEEDCHNNGTCQEMERDVYQCQCSEGFTGTNCQVAESRGLQGMQGWKSGLIISVSVSVMILAVVLIVYLCRKNLYIKQRWKHVWPFNNDSDVQLIGKALRCDLSGNTVILRDLHEWPHCEVHTCPCLPDFPVLITEGMNELPVSNLQPGFTYTFEICRQDRDVEGNGSCVASCDVPVEGFANEDEACTGTMKLIEDSISLRRDLDRVLAGSQDLRQCISSFFQFKERQSEAFVKSGDEPCVKTLCEILGAMDRLDCGVDSLLSHLARSKPNGAQEFAQKLCRSHPGCAVCPHICHHMHGGLTAWATQHDNQVTCDSSSNSTSV